MIEKERLEQDSAIEETERDVPGEGGASEEASGEDESSAPLSEEPGGGEGLDAAGQGEEASSGSGAVQTARFESRSLREDRYIGCVLGGRYVIKARIGRGGMGVVYLAEQRGLEREVVVKLLAADPEADDDISVERFTREAQSLSLLNHPNIVGVHDFGREGGESYIVMEYVEGIRLDMLIKRKGQLGLELFLPIARQILDALAEAHEVDMIHRDLKPSNVMLTERKGYPYYVKVLDFGLAKLLSDDTELTGKQNLVGSLSYLAPEQILGQRVDQRADVYALGVLFFYMLSGRKPFLGKDTRVLYQHVHEDPPQLGELLEAGHQLPDTLLALVHRCLSKEPAGRPRSAQHMLEELRAAVDPLLFEDVPWASGEMSAPSWSGRVPEGLAARSSEISNDSRNLVRPVADTGQGAAVHRESSSPSHPSASSQSVPAMVLPKDSVDEDSLPLLELSVSSPEHAPPARPRWVYGAAALGALVLVGALALAATGGFGSSGEVGAGASGVTDPVAAPAPQDPPTPSPEEGAGAAALARVLISHEGEAPEGVIVLVDGQPRGGPPVELELEPGQRYQLTATAPGHQRWSQALTPSPGPSSLSFALAPAPRDEAPDEEPDRAGREAQPDEPRARRPRRPARSREDAEPRAATPAQDPADRAPSEPSELADPPPELEALDEEGPGTSTPEGEDDIQMLEFGGDGKKERPAEADKPSSEFELLNLDE